MKLSEKELTNEQLLRVADISEKCVADDIFDKFDFERVSRILALLEDGSFGQVFITDTHLERVEKMIGEALKEKTKIFKL